MKKSILLTMTVLTATWQASAVGITNQVSQSATAQTATQESTMKIAYIIPGGDNSIMGQGDDALPLFAEDLLPAEGNPGDPVYIYLVDEFDAYTFEAVELGRYVDANETLKTYLAENYDAVVIREDIAGSWNTLQAAIHQAGKPMLNFGFYPLANRGYGINFGSDPTDGKKPNPYLYIPEEKQDHPLFEGLEFGEDGELEIITLDDLTLYQPQDAHANKTIQGMGSVNTDLADILGYGLNGDDSRIVSVMEALPAARPAAPDDAYWINISINRNAWYAINDNGYQMIKNAMNYMLKTEPSSPTGLVATDTGKEEPVRVEYFTIDGRGIDNPIQMPAGTLSIKKTTYKTGKIKTEKIIK